MNTKAVNRSRQQNLIRSLSNQVQLKIIQNFKRLLKKNYSYSFMLLKSLTRLTPTNFKNKLQLMVIILNNLVYSVSKKAAFIKIKKYAQDTQNDIIKGIFIVKSIIDRKVLMKSIELIQKLGVSKKKTIQTPKSIINQLNSPKLNENQYIKSIQAEDQSQKQKQLQNEIVSHLMLRKSLSARNMCSIFNRIKRVRLFIAFHKLQNYQKTQYKLLSKLKFVFAFQCYLQKLKLHLFFQFFQKIKINILHNSQNQQILNKNQNVDCFHIKQSKIKMISTYQHKQLQEQQAQNPQLKTKVQCIKTISTCIKKSIQKSNKMVNNIKNQIRTQKLVNALQAIQDRYVRVIFFELFYRTGLLFMEDCQQSKVQILQKQIQALRESFNEQQQQEEM